MYSLHIDPELQSLIPPMAEEEYRQLEKNLISDGCRDPLVVWNGIIVDGHNRYKICSEHGIEYKTVEKDFPGRASVVEWIILNQFGRRNLSPGNRSLLALKLEKLFKEKAKENQKIHGGTAPGKTLPQNSAEVNKPIETRKELAKIAGVSHDTIDKVKRIIAEGTPEQLERIKRGDKGNSVRAVYNEIFGKDKPSEHMPEEAPTESSYEGESDITDSENRYFDGKSSIEGIQQGDRNQTLHDKEDDKAYTPDVFLMDYELLAQEIVAKADWYKRDIFKKLYSSLSPAAIIELATYNRQMSDAIESLDQFQKTQALTGG